MIFYPLFCWGGSHINRWVMKQKIKEMIINNINNFKFSELISRNRANAKPEWNANSQCKFDPSFYSNRMIWLNLWTIHNKICQCNHTCSLICNSRTSTLNIQGKWVQSQEDRMGLSQRKRVDHRVTRMEEKESEDPKMMLMGGTSSVSSVIRHI